jgi:hypothetical protein
MEGQGEVGDQGWDPRIFTAVAGAFPDTLPQGFIHGSRFLSGRLEGFDLSDLTINTEAGGCDSTRVDEKVLQSEHHDERRSRAICLAGGFKLNSAGRRFVKESPSTGRILMAFAPHKPVSLEGEPALGQPPRPSVARSDAAGIVEQAILFLLSREHGEPGS